MAAVARISLYCLFIWSGILPLTAQLRTLDTIAIEADRLWDFASGHRLVAVDSALQRQYAAQSLGDLLAQHSDVFIKSYGMGSLATTSLRGGGANHTALIWNGFSLQSPMNGQQDLALLPVFFLDDVTVQYGGSAALYGSGAVGGAIHLHSRPVFGRGLHLGAHLNAGSFGLWQPGLDLAWSGERWLTRTRAFARRADNDFPLPGTQARQPHAALTQEGVLHEQAFRINQRQRLRLWAWWQQSQRELPPTLSEPLSAATQQDQQWRLAADWQHAGDQLLWKFRSAYLREGLRFQDPLADIDSDNLSHNWQQEAEAFWQIAAGHRLHAGANLQHQRAIASGYDQALPRQTLAALFLSYHWRSTDQRWEAIPSLRQGWGGPVAQPLTPSLSLRANLTDWLSLRAQAGRTFRLPTFNDLYWQPGGNPDLQPEQGWSQELGANLSGKIDSWRWQAQLGGFHQQLDNWILWRPGASFWYPENLRAVRSLGLESSAQLQYQQGAWSMHTQAGHTWTRARVTDSRLARDLSVGKQLIYTPSHQARIYAQLSYRHWSLSYAQAWTGRRYTTTDNTHWLAPYQVGTLFLSRRWGLPLGQLQAAIRIDNLWNATYQVIANRPMPGRRFTLSLDYTL